MKIFLGYPSEHLAEAREVAEYLRSRAESVWLDIDALAGGDRWDAERLEALRNADFIIHLCSNAINTRGGPVVREIRETLRLMEDQPFRSNLALCMRLEDIRLPLELMSIHYIDMFRTLHRHVPRRLEATTRKGNSQEKSST